MEYYTAEEAKRIMAHAKIKLCAIEPNNPNLAVARVLANLAKKNSGRDTFWAVWSGFMLGRATGIREERARRRKK